MVGLKQAKRYTRYEHIDLSDDGQVYLEKDAAVQEMQCHAYGGRKWQQGKGNPKPCYLSELSYGERSSMAVRLGIRHNSRATCNWRTVGNAGTHCRPRHSAAGPHSGDWQAIDDSREENCEILLKSFR